MKMLIGALALIIAVPTAAQTAPAADPHAGHAQEGQQHQGQHAQHQGKGGQQDHDCAKCCKEANGKMECQMMKGHGSQKSGQGSQHQGHAH